MNKCVIISVLACVCWAMTSCGGRGHKSGAYPEDFNERSDAYRVAWLMKNASPDSVARFICYASLGMVDGTRIDTLSTATLYAYEHYRDSDAIRFGDEYDRVVQSMPLDRKMRLYVMGGSEDPQSLGYKLGLEYMAHIREDLLTADDVERELKAFRKACGEDSATYRRFLIGFRTVLKIDRGKDVPEAIYSRFAEYE